MPKVLIAMLSLFAMSALFSGLASEDSVSNSNLRATQIAGLELFSLKGCNDCHTLADEADGELTPVSDKREDEWFKKHISDETEIVLREAKGARRQRRVLRDEISALDDYLFQSIAAEKAQIDALPTHIREGAYMVYQNNCLGCHKVAGTGKEVGPDLTFIADEHGDKSWLIENLKNPQQFAEESPMPKFDGLGEENLGKIADYLLTLKKK